MVLSERKPMDRRKLLKATLALPVAALLPVPGGTEPNPPPAAPETQEKAISALLLWCEAPFDTVRSGFETRSFEMPTLGEVRATETVTFTTIINHLSHGEGQMAPYAATWQEAVHQFKEGFEEFRLRSPGGVLYWRVKPDLRTVLVPRFYSLGTHRMELLGAGCLACGTPEEEIGDLACLHERRVFEQQTAYFVRARCAIGSL